MAHWRDGGIGNMAGSDDRPIEEWTLLEKLNELATAPLDGPMPKCMGIPTNWATPIKAIAKAAFDEIQRLRGGYPADLGDMLTKLRIIAADDIGDGLASTPVQLLREAINEIGRKRLVDIKLRLTEAHYKDALDLLGETRDEVVRLRKKVEDLENEIEEAGDQMDGG